MNVQVNALPPPVLSEAFIVGNDTVLYVHNLKDPTDGEVALYPNAAVGDEIELTVNTSVGKYWSGKLIVAPAIDPFVFKIPKSVFGEKPAPGATAKVGYSVAKKDGTTIYSPELLVYLKD
jgi:hypothetical protein